MGSPSLSGERRMVSASYFADIMHFDASHVGDISHVEVLGQHIVVLNSFKAAIGMLDKKSSIYSDRPTLTMAGELVGWNGNPTFFPYGDSLRWNRKNFHRVVGNRTAMMAYDVHLVEEIETRRFLKRVLAKPEELMEHVRQYGYLSHIDPVSNNL